MKTISDNILDILQNSTRAGATEVGLSIFISHSDDIMTITLRDNGYGFDKETAENITDPFTTSRTTRKIGLGLPLLKQHAELASGSLEIASEKGKGTTVTARFVLSSIDRQPLGDISETAALFINGYPSVNLTFSLSTDKGRYSVTSREIAESLEDFDLSKPWYFPLINELISENFRLLVTDPV